MDFHILVREGFVQRIMGEVNGEPAKIWPIAESHADANRLARWLKNPGVVAAQIGSVEGETLEGHVKIALEDGCEVIACVSGWNADGSPQWKYIPMSEQ